METFEKNAKAKLQSLENLIQFRNSLKQKVVEVNAKTVVEIAGEKMTIAGAIERKNFNITQRDVITKLRNQYTETINEFEFGKTRYTEGLNEIQKNLGDKSVDENLLKVSKEHYEKNNKLELIDPINLKEYYSKMSEELTNFINEVDVTLSEINATTNIELT